MNPMWLMRAARWVRHPPPLSRVLLVGAVLALCVGLAGVEYLWGWPDWLTLERGRRAFRP